MGAFMINKYDDHGTLIYSKDSLGNEWWREFD